MQRQPTPRADPNRKGHFLSRNEALSAYAGVEGALTNLEDLPSDKSEAKRFSESLKLRDIKKAKDAGVREWDGKKVQSIVTCYDCGKRRCMFSRKKDERYNEAVKRLQQKLESIDFRYTCGDLVSDDDPLSDVLAQRQNMRCSTPMESAYYMNKDRDFKGQDVCYYCGEGCSEEDRSSEFLL